MDSQGDNCPECEGTGYIEVVDDRRHRSTCPDRDNCGCTAVEPCPACVHRATTPQSVG